MGYMKTAGLFDVRQAGQAVVVSRCLLGIPCRYHGQRCRMGRPIGRPGLIARLRRRYRIIDICPEVDAGLPVPRPPTRIRDGRWLCAGRDVTAAFARGAALARLACLRHGVRKAYLLRGSPACDREFGSAGRLLRESGITVIGV